jgi:hypothetical protein
MKRLGVPVVVLALAVVICGGIYFSSIQAHKKALERECEGITNLFNEIRQASKDCVHVQFVGKKKEKVGNKREFLKRLMEIKTDQCPKDFQEAWVVYVQAYRNFADPSAYSKQELQLLQSPTKASVDAHGAIEAKGRVNVGLKSLITGDAGGEVGGKISGGGSVSVERDKDNVKEAVELLRKNDVRQFWEHLEDIAVAHGVNPFNDE